MRPQAFKNVNYEAVKVKSPLADVSWAGSSFFLLYIDLFCLIFFSLSVLSTHKRILLFLNESGKALPAVTKVFLTLSTYDYMTLGIMAGILLVMKEKNRNKKITFAINFSFLFLVWFLIFLYIWAMSLPFR